MLLWSPDFYTLVLSLAWRVSWDWTHRQRLGKIMESHEGWIKFHFEFSSFLDHILWRENQLLCCEADPWRGTDEWAWVQVFKGLQPAIEPTPLTGVPPSGSLMRRQPQMAVWPHFQHSLNQNHQVRQHLQSSSTRAWIKCYFPCQFNYIMIYF